MNFEHNQPSSTSNSSLTKSLNLNTLTEVKSFEFDFALCHNYGWCYCCGYR
jgi:hypothetical protein